MIKTTILLEAQLSIYIPSNEKKGMKWKHFGSAKAAGKSNSKK